MWRFAERGGSARFFAALVTAVLSVQCLYYNSFLLFAICVGASAVCLLRRDYTRIFLILDRKSTRLNSSHANIPYAVFCLKKKIDSLYFPLVYSPFLNIDIFAFLFAAISSGLIFIPIYIDNLLPRLSPIIPYLSSQP